MRKKAFIFLLITALGMSVFGCMSDSQSETAGSAVASDFPVSPWDYQKMLGRGMDVDWSKTRQGRMYYNTAAVLDFKAAGVSHVRIRVADDISEELLSGLEKQVQDCLDNQLIPIIAYQADDFKNDPVAVNKQPEKLNQLYELAVTAIRKTNPDRIIIISPRLRSDPAYLAELKIPSQHNGYLMAEWHFYAAGPSKTNERKLWTTGTDYEKSLINEKIGLALKWQEEQVFASYMTSRLTEAAIPFAVNSDTKFYDREKNIWIKEMQPVFNSIYH